MRNWVRRISTTASLSIKLKKNQWVLFYSRCFRFHGHHGQVFSVTVKKKTGKSMVAHCLFFIRVGKLVSFYCVIRFRRASVVDLSIVSKVVYFS